MVPEIISAELSKVSDLLCQILMIQLAIIIIKYVQPSSGEQNLLGSVYQQCRWQDCDVTIKRSVHYNNNNNKNNKIDYYINYEYTNKHLFKEVDILR